MNTIIRKKTALTIFAAATALASPTQAADIDLSSWSALTLNFPVGQNAGNWVLEAGNTSVTQTVNADPSFYLNNINQTAYSMDGSWKVKTSGDDDFMGFVFGYQNSSNFYLFDWKQSGQNNTYGADANEGMTIKKYTGATGVGLTDLSLQEFWENTTDFDDMAVLASNHGSSAGWADHTSYDFHLDFNTTTVGEFTIEVTEGATSLWDVTVSDSTFTSGDFGFYNFSQEAVEYSGFEQEGGVVVVPVPSGGSTVLMLAASLLGIGAVRRKLK